MLEINCSKSSWKILGRCIRVYISGLDNYSLVEWRHGITRSSVSVTASLLPSSSGSEPPSTTAEVEKMKLKIPRKIFTRKLKINPMKTLTNLQPKMHGNPPAAVKKPRHRNPSSRRRWRPSRGGAAGLWTLAPRSPSIWASAREGRSRW